MKKEHVAYLAAGMVFGFVIGLLVSYMIFFQKDTVPPRGAASPQAGMGNMQQPPEHADVMQEIAVLKEILQKEPSNYAALVRLGNIYFDVAKFPQAVDYYSRAVELDRSDPDVLTDLAICYRNMGDPEKAVGLFREAFDNDPSHWQSLYNLFIVSLNDLGDIPAAEEALRTFEKMVPDFENLEMMKKQLEQMKEEKSNKESAS